MPPPTKETIFQATNEAMMDRDTNAGVTSSVCSSLLWPYRMMEMIHSADMYQTFCEMMWERKRE